MRLRLRLAGLALATLGGGENRLWFVELELRGACERVRLVCGSDGETLLEGPFARGEDRRLSVPVPARSPLGSAGLAALPLPEVEVLPAGAPAEARVLGWSTPQRAAGLVPGGEPSSALPRPPVRASRSRARAPELLCALASGAFLLALRRRVVPSLGLALAGAAIVFLVARSRAPEPRVVELLQWNEGEDRALAVRVAEGVLPRPGEWLEVEPEGRPVTLEWSARGEGRARAPGARLAGITRVQVPDLEAGRNGWEPLAEVWTRSARGAWRAHGPWAAGEALGPPQGTGAPPGWSAGALPAGTGVLVARTRRGSWLRCLGFAGE